jgi:polysaccharide export outer membrane protein
MHGKRMIALWISLLAVTAVAVPQKEKKDAKSAPQTQSSAPVSNVPAADAAGTAASYVIGPQDVLQIIVWKETDLSGTVPVRPDGKISLALLNDVQAAGLTPMELSKDLTTRLKKFLSDPLVTVTVTQMNSQRFFVMGEVLHAGGFPLVGGQTVLQGLSAAGGLSEYANASKIYILRNEDGKQVKLPFNYKAVIKGEHPEQNVMLKAGDTIVVP